MILTVTRQQTLLLLSSLLLLLQSLSACHSSKVTTIDSLPVVSTTYNGYRLVISNIQIKKKGSKWATLEYNLVNTGRESIFYKKGKTAQPPIYFQFDNSLNTDDLSSYKEDIIQQVLNNDITLKAGQSLKNKTMKLQLDPTRKKTENSESDFTISVGESGITGSDYIDINYCSDLYFDTLVITRMNKNTVTLQYRIANKGKGPAAMRGTSGNSEDNLAIKAYLNRTGKLSKGAIPIGGTFINDKELLKPGEIYTGEFKLDISKKTKFSSILILELDPYLLVRECDETNNTGTISLGE
jgi:CARDB